MEKNSDRGYVWENRRCVAENNYNGEIPQIATDVILFLKKKKSHTRSFKLVIAFLLFNYYYHAHIYFNCTNIRNF